MIEIFVERRMDHLRDELMRKGLWNDEDNKVYEQVRTVMVVNELENHNSNPSLLHGDYGWQLYVLNRCSPAYSILHRFMAIGSLI